MYSVTSFLKNGWTARNGWMTGAKPFIYRGADCEAMLIIMLIYNVGFLFFIFFLSQQQIDQQNFQLHSSFWICIPDKRERKIWPTTKVQAQFKEYVEIYLQRILRKYI